MNLDGKYSFIALNYFSRFDQTYKEYFPHETMIVPGSSSFYLVKTTTTIMIVS